MIVSFKNNYEFCMGVLHVVVMEREVTRLTFKRRLHILIILDRKNDVSRLMTKPTKWHVRPAKTQISLGIRPV